MPEDAAGGSGPESGTGTRWERDRITVADLEPLAMGAAILGTGGGGDPRVGKLMAQRAIEEHGPVDLVDPADVPEDALVIPSGMMGAPTVGLEKLPNGAEPVTAIERVAEAVDRELYATMPAECGGGNSTIPLTVAARLGVPVIDGDGMGRAFPELHQVSFNVYGVDAAPAVLADEHGNVVTFDTVDGASLERFARAVTTQMGARAALADHPMTGTQVRETAIANTVSLCIRLGNAVLDPPAGLDGHESIKRVTAASNYGRGIDLFAGKIVDVERRTREGFAVGSVTFDGLDEHEGETMTIEFQNENLVARREGETVATVPDLITVLEAETGRPITTERLRYGYRARVVAIPAPAIMRTEEALAVWGPRYFGYDEAFVPLERRFQDYYREHGVPEEKQGLLDG